MKINKQVLEKAIDLCVPFASKRSNDDNVLLYSDGNNVYLSASFGAGNVFVNLGSESNYAGDIMLVPLYDLHAAVKTSSESDLELSVSDNKKSIFFTSKNAETNTIYKITRVDASDFIKSELVDRGYTIEIASDELKEAVKFVLTTVGKSTYLSIQNSIHIFYENGMCIVESTDGYRLSKYFIHAQEKSLSDDMKLDVVIPADFAKVLTRADFRYIDLLYRVSAGVKRQAVCFKTKDGSAKVVFVYYDDTYPNTSSVLPATFSVNVSVNPKELSKVLRDMEAVYKNERNKDVFVKVSKNCIKLGAYNGGVRKYSSVRATSNKDAAFVINGEFLYKGLRQFTSYSSVNIDINDGSHPIVIYADKSKMYQVIMPIIVDKNDEVFGELDEDSSCS